MKMKTTLLTLCLVMSITLIAKWTPSLVSANTTVAVCGQVLGYTPATAVTAGSIRIDSTVYPIAPGATISGAAILKIGASVCLDLAFNSSNEIIPPSKVGGSTVNICGSVNSFTPSTSQTLGSISIGSATYAIAQGVKIDGESGIFPGSGLCLTATLNGAGQISPPSAVKVNVISPVVACGPVSNFQAATSSSSGYITVGGLSFTIGAGVSIGSVSVGSNRCLQGVTDINGQLISPSSTVSNPGGGSKVCGAVTSFQQAFFDIPGKITLGGVSLPLAPTIIIPGQDKIALGSNVCISPLVLSGGYVVAGSVFVPGESGCLQFSAPALVHGTVNDQDDTFLLPKPLVFSVLSGSGSAGVFDVNPDTFGFPAIYGTKPQGVVASGRNTTIRALTCMESFWDLIFDVATKGNTEGDMITLFLQNPNGSNVRTLAMFTVQNGGLLVNQVHPEITLLVGGNGPYGAGQFIPLLIGAGASGVKTAQLTMIFSMDARSTVMGCAQLGVDIKRMGGTGMTSFVPQYVVVIRKGDEQEGQSIQSGGAGLYPTGAVCEMVCNGCFQQPTPSPTPTPTPTVAPTETPEPTPTPTPGPMPIKCDTICFHNSAYFLLRLDYLPGGSILIGGVNLNNPVSILRSKDAIRNALDGGPTPMDKLNEQFVPLQLSYALSGGTASPVVFNTFWSPLRCSGVQFTPVTLSNGVTLSPDSLLDTLVNQTVLAIKQNRTADMAPLAAIMKLLNSRC